MKVLYIAKSYSQIGLGGTRRIKGIAEYFENHHKCKLHFLTENTEKNKIKNVILINTPKFLRDSNKILSSQQTKTKSVKLLHKGWFYFFPASLSKILFRKFDVIYATSPVFLNLIIALIYKLFHPSCFMIIEYRDLYTMNPSFLRTFSLIISQKLELFILKKTNLIVTTTNGMKNKIQSFLPNLQIEVIPNYITYKDYNNPYFSLGFNKNYFHVGYIGSINTGRDPSEILELLDHSIQNKKIIFHFVGNSTEQELIIKKKFNERSDVIFHGIVSRKESLNFMHNMDALYLIMNPDSHVSDGYGIPGKLFDYIALKNIIISKEYCIQEIEKEIKIEILQKIGSYFIFEAKETCFLENVLAQKIDKYFKDIY
ncbi:MAG TPA: glycosyltransferase family 4 protein [Gallicola sp.]|nr:glycosyltransferase family 4 protein [Gallicola sp.]